jgi:excisionase family DNA binding protein
MELAATHCCCLAVTQMPDCVRCHRDRSLSSSGLCTPCCRTLSRQALYLQRKESGLCIYCGVNPPRDRASSCTPCADHRGRACSKANWVKACRQADKAINRGLVPLQEAADLLSVSKSTVQRYVRLGRLQAFKIPRQRGHYVRRSALTSYLTGLSC